MKTIVWLASYPKSGNTWLRAFLTNYLSEVGQPVDLNRLVGQQITTWRDLFDEYTGIDSSDLTIEEMSELRPIFHKMLSEECVPPYFIKIHDLYSHSPRPLFPDSATLGVVYLIRNPLDVAVSYAHHKGTDIDGIIHIMQNSDYTLAYRDDTYFYQFPQLLGSWTDHAVSWLDHSSLPTCIVRYEDMLDKPVETFGRIIQFCGLDLDLQRLQTALERASFPELKKQEAEQGFAERHPKSKNFFRVGKSGTWRDSLTVSQVKQIVSIHGQIMERFEYVSV